jgi:hypothetical protein
MDLIHSPLFTPWKNPVTGVTLYLLTRKVAPVQEAFYFVNNSLSADGRFLWFYCAFPPAGTAAQGRTLGVVDFERQQVHHYPETQFNHASPYVEPETGAVYWCGGASIWRRGPLPGDAVELVNSLPPDLIGMRPVERLATHLSRSCDGSRFFVDAAVGLQYVFGTLPVDGGDFEFWHRFDRNHNHAQFSPRDPDLALFAEENHPDPLTGLRFPITNRLWLIRKGQSPRPVMREPTRVTHEWWDADGQHAWCVQGHSAWRVDVASAEVEVIEWPSHCWHAHNSQASQYVVADSNEKFFRGCPSSVGFLNRQTGAFVKLVDNPGINSYAGKNYHIDPHPRFVGEDQYVVFTTTVRGEIDLAVARVEELVRLTGG